MSANAIDRLRCALEQMDAANLADPRLADWDGKPLSQEWIYSQHMTRWLFVLEPAPSELLQMACRAQHIERWTLPRSSHPEGRAGYYEWRQACGQMHGARAAEIMHQCGYAAAECARVEAIISKRDLPHDADTQTMEDVACMVFLEQYFADFYAQKPDYDTEQWLRIVRRTWDKMSPRGHTAALQLAGQLPAHLLALVQEAIA
jgi:hypothetical protein